MNRYTLFSGFKIMGSSDHVEGVFASKNEIFQSQGGMFLYDGGTDEIPSDSYNVNWDYDENRPVLIKVIYN